MPAIPLHVDLADPTFALSRRLPTGASIQPLRLGSDPHILLDTWLIEYTLGQILMLILIGTLLWKRRATASERSWSGLTQINMLLTMFLNSTVNLILYYAGEAANPDPPTGLCLVQAALRHGTGPMTEVAIMSLGIETFLFTRSAVTMKTPPVGIVVLLLILPYLSFLLWSIPIAVMGTLYPFNIQRLGQANYCSYSNNLYGDISTVYGVLAILITAIAQACTARFLHHMWRETRSLRSSDGPIDVSLITRIWIFTGLQILFILLTLIQMLISPYVPKPTSSAFDQVVGVFQAFVPGIAFILFGLRTSNLEVWFWWWPRSPSPTVDHSSIAFNSDVPQRSTVLSRAASVIIAPLSREGEVKQVLDENVDDDANRETVPHPSPPLRPPPESGATSTTSSRSYLMLR